MSPRHAFALFASGILVGFVALAVLVPEAWLVVIPLAFLVALFAIPEG